MLSAEQRLEAARRLFRQVCRYGLKVSPEDLTEREVADQGGPILELLEEGQTPLAVQDAIQGMGRIWPFTDGRPWGGPELKANITKAKGGAGRHANMVPHRIQELPSDEPSSD